MKSDAPVPIGEAVDASGGAALARLRLQRVDGVDGLADLRAGEDLLGLPGVVGVEGHELDEADLVGSAPGERGEWDQLVLGEAADGDGVDLDRVRLREAGEDLESAQHLR